MQKPSYAEIQVLIASFYIDAFPDRPTSDIQDLWDYAFDSVDYNELISEKAFKNLILDFTLSKINAIAKECGR